MIHAVNRRRMVLRATPPDVAINARADSPSCLYAAPRYASPGPTPPTPAPLRSPIPAPAPGCPIYHNLSRKAGHGSPRLRAIASWGFTLTNNPGLLPTRDRTHCCCRCCCREIAHFSLGVATDPAVAKYLAPTVLTPSTRSTSRLYVSRGNGELLLSSLQPLLLISLSLPHLLPAPDQPHSK